ncbi:hypothetical protein BGX31_008547, partial [Mortierella sp. GBA43]
MSAFRGTFDNKVIRYTTLREIQPYEELCVSYGPNLWFPDMEQQPNEPDQVNDLTGQTEICSSEDETEDAFLAKLQLSDDEDLDL